jgi:hypothetical protein
LLSGKYIATRNGVLLHGAIRSRGREGARGAPAFSYGYDFFFESAARSLDGFIFIELEGFLEGDPKTF